MKLIIDTKNDDLSTAKEMLTFITKCKHANLKRQAKKNKASYKRDKKETERYFKN